MLEKSMYDSWASRIHLFIKGKKHGRMMLDSINNVPLVYPTVKEDRQTRTKKYLEISKAQQLQDDCDVQATNIILHGLSPDVLYNLFDKFAYQVQVNTKFLSALPPEWSKFVTDVKLAKTLYTNNYDQLYAYLSQHERHAEEIQGRQTQSYAGTDNRGIATTSKGNYAASQPRVMKCYNCQGEGHMARWCTQPKRPRNAEWFKEKLMLAKAQEAGQLLDEEQLAFLADPGINEAPVAQ
ncbi:integrase, catalytic region, zinc finger, CCHC-type containing protein [Tanacetum coccineum]